MKEFKYMANLARKGDTITILIKDQDGVRETLTFTFKGKGEENTPKTPLNSQRNYNETPKPQ